MQLRPRQEEFVSKTLEALEDHQSVLSTACTGAGKTVMVGFIIARWLEANPDRRVLVLQHVEELLQQNMATIAKVAKVPCSVVQAKKKDWTGRIIFGSIATVARNLESLPDDIGLLVVDEAHRAAAPSYLKTWEAAKAKGARLLGVTATAERGDKKDLSAVFDTVADRIAAWEVVESGHLVCPVSMAAEVGLTDAIAALRMKGSDFDMLAAEDLFNVVRVNQAIVQTWKEQAAGRQTIAFCATVKHAETLAATFAAEGITAGAVSGDDLAKERAESVQTFRAGQTTVLSNAAVFVEGFDHAPTSCVILARPYGVRGAYLQSIGRVLRTAEGKSDAIILDFALNLCRHGALEHYIAEQRHEHDPQLAGKPFSNEEAFRKALKDSTGAPAALGRKVLSGSNLLDAYSKALSELEPLREADRKRMATDGVIDRCLKALGWLHDCPDERFKMNIKAAPQGRSGALVYATSERTGLCLVGRVKSGIDIKVRMFTSFAAALVATAVEVLDGISDLYAQGGNRQRRRPEHYSNRLEWIGKANALDLTYATLRKMVKQGAPLPAQGWSNPDCTEEDLTAALRKLKAEREEQDRLDKANPFLEAA